MRKRNSLIELYRFLFAMNVLIGHGFYPTEINRFGPDRISVEFFFILSGFLFCKSLTKIKDMSVGGAVKSTLISKIKPILIPTVIGMICNGIFNYLTDFTPVFEVFRFLWYIPAMLAVMVVYAILRSLIKSDSTFWWIALALCILTTALRYSGNQTLFYFDYIRSTASVSLGMLVAKLPKPTFKRKAFSWLLLAPAAALAFVIIYYRLALNSVGYEALLDVVLYPIIIYLSFGIDFSFAPFNYLGAISFGIYAFQCSARLVQYLGVFDSLGIFIMIFALAIVEDLIKRIVRKSGRLQVDKK